MAGRHKGVKSCRRGGSHVETRAWIDYAGRDRLVKVQNTNSAGPDGDPRFTDLRLDKEDLCVAKLVAFRGKDRNSVAAPRATRTDRLSMLFWNCATCAADAIDTGEPERFAARRASLVSSEGWLSGTVSPMIIPTHPIAP